VNKKAFFYRIVIFSFLQIAFVSCASFGNWAKRINLTTGAGLPLKEAVLEIDNINEMSDTIEIVDGFGDHYATSWELKQKENEFDVPFYVCLSFPCYWRDFSDDTNIETGIIAKMLFPHYNGAGIYFEGTKGRFGVSTSIGISMVSTPYEVITKPAGKAWANDPGIYTNGSFHSPYTFNAKVDIKEDLKPGFFISIAGKWHFLRFLYLEDGYSYYGKAGTEIKSIKVSTSYTKDKEYDASGSATISGNHIFYIGIGVGN